VQRLGKDGASATSIVRVGTPVEEITKVAHEQHADLIVMGTHGRTGLQHMLVGSVAERVVRTSTTPVLTVRHPDQK
jgi:nucleotide-binding universal stress UspA family protein